MNSIVSRVSLLLFLSAWLLFSYHLSALGLDDMGKPTDETMTISLPAEAFSVPDVYSKVFDGKTTAHPTVEISPDYLLPGDAITVSYEKAAFSEKYVGDDKQITVSGLSLSGENSQHYILSDPTMTVTSNNGQILPITLDIQKNATLKAGGDPFDLSNLITGCQQDLVLFEIEGDCAGSVLCDCILTPGPTEANFQLKVKIHGQDFNEDGILEYADGSGFIDILIEAPKNPSDETHPAIPPTEPEPPSNGDTSTTPPTKPTPPEGNTSTPSDNETTSSTGKREQQSTLSLRGTKTMPYGASRSLATIGGSGQGAVHYHVSNLTGAATLDRNNVLTATKAGTISIMIEKEGDSNYLPTQSEPTTFEIEPVSLTITAGNLYATVGDSIPSPFLAGYTVSGLVGNDQLTTKPTLSYALPPNMSQEGEVEILAQGAVVPLDGNYSSKIQYKLGSLTIQPMDAFPIYLSDCPNGTITASPRSATKGTLVTVTYQGSKGYVLKSLFASTKDGRPLSLSQKGDSSRTFIMPNGAVTLSAVFQKAENQLLPFSDVKESDWFYEAVRYNLQSGLMNGTSEQRFEPNAHTTRAMLVTILHRMEGSPSATGASPFSDVPKTAYYAAPIAWANKYGIVTGTSPTRFSPEDRVTREQFATILYRYAKANEYDMVPRVDLGKFKDAAQIQPYAKEALSWCNAVGLLNGTTQTTLDPSGLAERAQVAAIFYRFCTKLNPS